MQRCSHLFKLREALASCCFQTAGSYLGTWLTLPGSSYISWNLVAIPRVPPPGCRDFWVEKLPSFIVAWKKGKVFFPTKLVQYNNLQLLPLGKRWLKKPQFLKGSWVAPLPVPGRQGQQVLHGKLRYAQVGAWAGDEQLTSWPCG